MAEETILKEGNIVVTISRFIVSGQTYAMSGVTSVQALVSRPIKGPLILIGLGLLLLFAMFSSKRMDAGDISVSAVFIICGVLWSIYGVKHIVVLCSASGEAEALASRNRLFINRIIRALNEAIVRRG